VFDFLAELSASPGKEVVWWWHWCWWFVAAVASVVACCWDWHCVLWCEVSTWEVNARWRWNWWFVAAVAVDCQRGEQCRARGGVCCGLLLLVSGSFRTPCCDLLLFRVVSFRTPRCGCCCLGSGLSGRHVVLLLLTRHFAGHGRGAKREREGGRRTASAGAFWLCFSMLLSGEAMHARLVCF
jgi:hypothetical protein